MHVFSLSLFREVLQRHLEQNSLILKWILECLAKCFFCSTCCFHTFVMHWWSKCVFREISLIGTFHLKSVLTIGNLSCKTWIACLTVKHKTRSSIACGLTSCRTRRYKFHQSLSATSIIYCWQNSIWILKRDLVAWGRQQISSILIKFVFSRPSLFLN